MSIGDRPGDGGDEPLYFVHGTTTAIWRSEAITAQGAGEFGGGFYVFEDTRWGRESAALWAKKKAYGDGGEPILVRVRIVRGDFIRLDRKDVDEDALDRIYRSYAPRGRTGESLVIGPVGKKDANGRRVANRRLPPQYKFEENGIIALAYDSLILVR